MQNIIPSFDTIPAWANYSGDTGDPDYTAYFDTFEEAKKFSALNEVIIRNMHTGEILINTLDYQEEE